VKRWGWPALILSTALLLRLLCLGNKPLHFDEGVNGSFVDQMTRDGFYHYEPSNYHGPLHFYSLFTAQTLLGRHAWALRLPTALVSTACVALLLAFQSPFGKRPARIAAAAMALSPAMTFYGRYAIHETWLVFFLLLAFWGLLHFHTAGTRRSLWALCAGITGILLTKETGFLHIAAALIALPVLRAWERFSPSLPPLAPRGHAPTDPAPPQWTKRDLFNAICTCSAVLVFFYSGCLLDWSSLPGFWQSPFQWMITGTGGESGHEKPWFYWFALLLSYEWPALLGLVFSLFFLLRSGTPHSTRLLALYAAGAFAAYTLVSYKTPWCLISLTWPWLLLFGIAIDRISQLLHRTAASAIAKGAAALLLLHSSAHTLLLNFRNPTDEDHLYVYVQTLPEVRLLLDPLASLTRQNPVHRQLRGALVLPELHPWSWLLNDYPNVLICLPEELKEPVGPRDFLLVDSSLAASIEAQLDERYFKASFRIRGNTSDPAILYLRAHTFASCFPERTPEFAPDKIQPPAQPQPESATQGRKP